MRVDWSQTTAEHNHDIEWLKQTGHICYLCHLALIKGENE